LRHSFPEMLSIQASKLVAKIKEESERPTGGPTRKLLRERIASLSQPEVTRATDALKMIWSYANGSLKPLAAEIKPNPPVVLNFPPNWHRVKLAFLKSITTGVFLDAQFYAFNKIYNNTPFDPKPLFISSIVIEEWAPAITTREWKNFLVLVSP
jgi:hypothetical protein